LTETDFIFEGPAFTTDRTSSTLAAVAEAMRLLLQARHLDTSEHAARVSSLAMAVLERLDPLAAADPTVGLSYDLHDIGKAALPDAVLNKPASLTDEEWETMRRHPVIGAQILEAVVELRGSLAVTIIRNHHERWDGAGYPDRLAGEAIPIECRAFSVVDAFDAMTNDRPYRRAMPVDVALAELRANAGRQFDPAAVVAFEDVTALDFAWASPAAS
jgi:HD-GYP domain-containing protein (c-di-GMP phosphodiesterase class II)